IPTETMSLIWANDIEWLWVGTALAGAVICLLNPRLSRWMYLALFGISLAFYLRLLILLIYLEAAGALPSLSSRYGLASFEAYSPFAFGLFMIGRALALLDIRRQMEEYKRRVPSESRKPALPDCPIPPLDSGQITVDPAQN